MQHSCSATNGCTSLVRVHQPGSQSLSEEQQLLDVAAVRRGEKETEAKPIGLQLLHNEGHLIGSRKERRGKQGRRRKWGWDREGQMYRSRARVREAVIRDEL